MLFVILPFTLILFGPTGANYRITERLDPGTGRWVDITPPHPMAPYAWALVGAGWFFWLYWVYRVHQAAAAATTEAHAVSAGKAAVLHLVPLYNLYWVFAWPSALLKTCQQTPGQTVKIPWASWLFCLGLLVLSLSVIPPGAVLGAALALAIVLIAAGSLSRRLKGLIA
jgi:hypothetical protein